MARVRRIHTLRRALGPTALKAYGLVLFVFALISTVSVANVIANMPSVTTPGALGSFFVNALTHTELLVQLILGGMVVAAAMLVRDVMHRKAGYIEQPLAHA